MCSWGFSVCHKYEYRTHYKSIEFFWMEYSIYISYTLLYGTTLLFNQSNQNIHFFYPFNCNDNTIGIDNNVVWERVCVCVCIHSIWSHDMFNLLNRVVNVSMLFSFYISRLLLLWIHLLHRMDSVMGVIRPCIYSSKTTTTTKNLKLNSH